MSALKNLEDLRQLFIVATDEIKRLQEAIREHRDQRGDDRCWLDDLKLYSALGEDVIANNNLPPKDKFLANCGRFYDSRCHNANWPSYQELEAIVKAADSFEHWLGKNSGDNAYWPIRITCDEAGAVTVTMLLSKLHEALKPWRSMSKNGND